MAAQTINPTVIWDQPDQNLTWVAVMRDSGSPQEFITRAASRHTYYTIRFLVDRDRIQDAYRAYAYFRWVDDLLDQTGSAQSERVTFLERQRTLMNHCEQDVLPRDLAVEERMLVDLFRRDSAHNSGLHSYIRHMMEVMAFDAHRRGRLISQEELTTYSRNLAVAVTNAMHYFIGHDDATPQSETRYLAVTAAHITHMLRDTCEDITAGYFNIPREFLESHHLDPADVQSEMYRAWVKGRVQLARAYFQAGRDYLAQVRNIRCRIAGYAYTARFEAVLDAIERDNYQLRRDYPECKIALLKLIRTILAI